MGNTEWSALMKFLFGAQEVSDLVQNGYEELVASPIDAQRTAYSESKKKGCKTLFYIQHNMDSYHFEKIAKVTKSKEACDIVKKYLGRVEIGGLIKPFTEVEVKQAVWDCDSYKSPGPDGINFGFIKDFWVELRGDVMRFLSDFHRNGRLTKGINATFIALIPKTDSPQRLNDFRPISLVGSLYKILAKVLDNRLRQVIDSVIFESQTTFVKNRQILDGILIANEIVDEARKSKKDLMLFKVDFEIAYDSVDWGYLD
ncbi:cysteine-rich receptor-like protein kinase, partial [Trifolium pratense]